EPQLNTTLSCGVGWDGGGCPCELGITTWKNENPGGVRETPTKPTNPTSRTSVLMTEQRPATTRTSLEVDAFLADLKVHKESSVSGHLIFALDATASRKETWDMACQLQGAMFQTVAGIGGPGGRSVVLS